MVNVHLNKELRKTHKRRAFAIKKGDKVKILRGSFAGSAGKVLVVDRAKSLVEIDGVERVKGNGSKMRAKIHSSKVELIELNTSDKKRKTKPEPRVAEKAKAESEKK
jgi:large subunit ribosomal protein L24